MTKRVVVLKLARLSIPQKIEKARFIVTSMTGNANFPAPSPALTIITANVNTLEVAHLASQGGGTDETALMYAREYALDLSLKTLSAYVESVANNNPANAEAIILSSGMEVKGYTHALSHDFHVEPTDKPGEVRLSTRFNSRATYIWQMTTTPESDLSWTTVDQGTQSRIIKDGLISGTRYFFRVAVVDKDGQEPWSNVLNTIVL